MRKLVLSTIGAAALLVSGAASAIPFTTGLTLSDPTTGTTFCTVDCNGTVTIDVLGGPITAATNATFDILGLNIEITDGNPAVSTGLFFGDILPLPGANFVTVVNGSFTDVYATLATTFAGGTLGYLSIAGNDWTVSGAGIAQGGSGSAIPEPSAIALLGIGLVGFGAASRRMRSKTS